MKWKKDSLPDYWLNNFFFLQFCNNFLTLLLCKMNFFDIFDVGNFFQFFVRSQSTEILMKSNFWLGMYVPSIHSLPKVWYDQDFSTPRFRKVLKKSTMLWMSKTFILRNNNCEKLLTNCQKNCPIKNETTFLFFALNEFIHISESIRNFSIFFPVFENFLENFEKWM